MALTKFQRNILVVTLVASTAAWVYVDYFSGLVLASEVSTLQLEEEAIQSLQQQRADLELMVQHSEEQLESLEQQIAEKRLQLQNVTLTQVRSLVVETWNIYENGNLTLNLDNGDKLMLRHMWTPPEWTYENNTIFYPNGDVFISEALAQ